MYINTVFCASPNKENYTSKYTAICHPAAINELSSSPLFFETKRTFLFNPDNKNKAIAEPDVEKIAKNGIILSVLYLPLRKGHNIMYRTNTCGELRTTDISKEVTLAGWVQTVRKFGAITFVDLRDRYGLTQLLFGEELTKQLEANPLGREFVLQATGTVSERSSRNASIPTGDIEINIRSYKTLNKSAVPPFTIQDDTDGGDDLRMKYRFLD